MTQTDFDTDPLSFLYPPIEVDQSGYMPVGDGHQIWWEASGNPDGIPVIYLHGGPGAAPATQHRRFFDPEFYWLVVFHQRGCGKSTPLAGIEANTTWHLIADIEQLRTQLRIDKWLVVGGSWGTCLAVAYGGTHPERCLGFRLRGVCLGRPSDIDWWWNGTRMQFPEAYDELITFLPVEERDDPLAAYHRRLVDPSPEIHIPASRSIKQFSGQTVHIKPNMAKQAEAFRPELSLPLARLFAHYSVNMFFFSEKNFTLDIVKNISHLPCIIVQGRFDVTTPPENAWSLHKAWPGSVVHMVADAAHDELDPSLARVMLQVHEDLKELLHQHG